MWDENPYYNPEKFNLFIVDSCSLDDEPYQFDYLVVWRHRDNDKLYWARDSGCSCPTPFEKIISIDDLGTLSRHDFPMIEKIVNNSPEKNSQQARYFLREIKAACEQL